MRWLPVPADGDIWIGGSRRWRCRRRVGDVQPGESLREWECVRGSRTEVGRVGQFGDRYVQQNWRPATQGVPV